MSSWWRSNDPSVKLTHVPTGVEAKCNGERTQFRNMQAAKKLLRARLWAKDNIPATGKTSSYLLPDDQPYPDDVTVFRTE